MTSNPYMELPPRAFWRSAIADRHFLHITDLWRPKFGLSVDDRIITAGSCFAQHIGNALKARGFNWYDAEPAPQNRNAAAPRPDILSKEDARKFNYGIFSFRTGNIYTTSLLLQWLEWATGARSMSEEVWEQNGRFYDPFRPTIEPDGFSSAEEVLASRRGTLAAIERAIKHCSLFVFTLGLTECWRNSVTGDEYPLCPGTVAGVFEAGKHQFDNMRYNAVHDCLSDAIARTRILNPSCRFLLTVSPVPLTASASGNHVLTATTYSKSVLRAVAGDIAHDLDYVDYFPSYEIISSFPARSMFFEPNLRSVTPEGVAHVMEHFFSSFGFPQSGKLDAVSEQSASRPAAPERDAVEVLCEEALLQAFGPGSK